MVIPIFVQKALIGDDIPIFGDGEQKRSFTYVGDVINGMTKLMANDKSLGQVINIGNESEITINELAKLVIEKTSSKSKIKYISYKDAYGKGFEDMRRRKPDLTKIQKMIGFKPTVDIEQIIDEVIEYQKSN